MRWQVGEDKCTCYTHHKAAWWIGLLSIIVIVVIVVPVVLAAKKPDVSVVCGYSLCNPSSDCQTSIGSPGEALEFVFKVKNNAISDGNGKISKLTVYDLQEIGRAVQQECRDRSRMPSSA
eukprot:TRINITY_DN1241_c0_g2_i4.p1 TRINITY_DN1241_c0_g2~~TRINITY_DN1241_c0_g2_i4.p1  ORF type:complete len:120 (-),score=16.24 TRINITY_DN1241_c0_g2_i4:36-395(-)